MLTRKHPPHCKPNELITSVFSMITRQPIVGISALLILGILSAGPASAATPVIDYSGQLIGAQGIDVNGTLYDVEFVDGTCNAVFGDCVNPDNFVFVDSEAGRAASAALIEQVFDTHEDIDDDPWRTRGCEAVHICHMFTLVKEQIPENGPAQYRLRINADNYYSFYDFADGITGPWAVTIDDGSSETSHRGDRVWVRWSEASVVVDTDGDGVPDDTDDCAGTPAGEPVDGRGCSASQLDADQDGVADAIDQCADTPADEAADENGCSASQRDTDNDGLNDAIDSCPETAAGAVVDETGCAISDYCPCDSARNHGQHQNCVTQTAREFKTKGLISRRDQSDFGRSAAKSSCGK